MNKPFPFQVAQAHHAAQAPGGRWMFCDEMQVGKTLQTLLAAKERGTDRVLVVAPAKARGTWLRQVQRWWPERADDVALIDMSPARKTQSKKRRALWDDLLRRRIRVVSPELLDPKRERAWLNEGESPLVVLDEAHAYVDPHSKWSKKLRKTTHRYRGGLYVCTATPISNRPEGAWNLFDLVFPGRFGTCDDKHKASYTYSMRYVDRIYGPYGSVPGGLNEEYAAELAERLEWMMTRTTRRAIAHLLPACQIAPLTVPKGEFMRNVVFDWWETAQLEATHLTILTHKRETARKYAEMLRECADDCGLVVHMDGSLPATRRDQLIEQLRNSPRGILVTTMHAVSGSISLAFSTRALFAELYWSPEQLIQAVGRFAGMGSSIDDPVVLSVCCGASTVNERIAFNVAEKLWDNKQLVDEGATEEGLRTALEGARDDEQALLDAAYCVVSDEDMEMFSSFEEGD